MQTMQSILNRRSVRSYTDQSIADEDLEALVRAAMAAPSAGNEQPWHFVVLTDRELLDAIPEFHPYAKMLKNAPAAIVVVGDETLEKHKGYWVQDCSAATQNILLAAHDLGIGSCWLGVHPVQERVEKMRALLAMPGHVIPFAVVALGYPADEPAHVDRYNPDRVHRNGWT